MKPIQRLVLILAIGIGFLLYACSRANQPPQITTLISTSTPPTVSKTIIFRPNLTGSPTPLPIPPIISKANLDQIQILGHFDAGDALRSFNWSPDGASFLMTYTGELRLLNANQIDPVWDTELGGRFSYFQNQQQIAVVSRESVDILDASSGKPINSLRVGPCLGDDSLIRISPDGHWVATAGFVDHGPALAIWLVDLQKPACPKRFQDFPGTEGNFAIVGDLAFSLDSHLLLAAAHNEIMVWDLPGGKQLARINGYAASFHNNGRWLAVASVDGITLYDLKNFTVVRTFPDYGTRAFDFSLDGELLVTSSADGSSRRINFYDINTGYLINAF